MRLYNYCLFKKHKIFELLTSMIQRRHRDDEQTTIIYTNEHPKS